MAQAAFIPKVAERTDIVSRIGNTPLIRLARITADLPGIEIYGKAEHQAETVIYDGVGLPPDTMNEQVGPRKHLIQLKLNPKIHYDTIFGSKPYCLEEDVFRRSHPAAHPCPHHQGGKANPRGELFDTDYRHGPGDDSALESFSHATY